MLRNRISGNGVGGDLVWSQWPTLTPLHTDQITFGTALRGLVYEDQQVHETSDLAVDFVRTLWRFFQQTIASITRERAERPLRRQLARAKLPDTHVTVIDLRRSATRGDGHSEVEWSHRWLVRGHWRNQWYPSEETHRLIYINPFIKGPDGAPLLLRDKVYNLTR